MLEFGGPAAFAARSPALVLEKVVRPESGRVDVVLDVHRAAETRCQFRAEVEAVHAEVDGVGDVVNGGFDQSVNTTLNTSTAADTPALDLDVDARVGEITVQERP